MREKKVRELVRNELMRLTIEAKICELCPAVDVCTQPPATQGRIDAKRLKAEIEENASEMQSKSRRKSFADLPRFPSHAPGPTN
jgi:hypothetical protein